MEPRATGDLNLWPGPAKPSD